MRELTGGFSCIMGAQRLIILEVPPAERLVRAAALSCRLQEQGYIGLKRQHVL